MKLILTFVVAALAAAPAFASAVPAPDGGATALLAALSVSGLIIAKNALKNKR